MSLYNLTHFGLSHCLLLGVGDRNLIRMRDVAGKPKKDCEQPLVCAVQFLVRFIKRRKRKNKKKQMAVTMSLGLVYKLREGSIPPSPTNADLPLRSLHFSISYPPRVRQSLLLPFSETCTTAKGTRPSASCFHHIMWFRTQLEADRIEHGLEERPKPLRVQVPYNHILTRNLYYNYYSPKRKYLIIGYMDPKP